MRCHDAEHHVHDQDHDHREDNIDGQDHNYESHDDAAHIDDLANIDAREPDDDEPVIDESADDRPNGSIFSERRKFVH